MKTLRTIITTLLVYAQLLATAAHAHSVRRTEPKLLRTLQNVTFTPTLADDAAPTELSVSFTLSGSTSAQRVSLSLTRDEDVYAQPVAVHRLRADGSVRSTETTPPGDHLAYHGTASTSARDAAGGRDAWARVSVHVSHGVPLLEGAYFVDGFEHHIQTDATYRRTRGEEDAVLAAADTPYNVVWRYADEGGGGLAERGEGRPTCGFGGVDYAAEGSLERRQSSEDTTESLLQSIGSKSGCPSTRAIALLGVVTDCAYTAQFASAEDIRRTILTLVNTASRVYEASFNVQLRVRNITISDSTCPTGSAGYTWNRACSSSMSISDRLNEFSSWKAGFAEQPASAAWTLMTACSTGSTVGIAWIRSVCQPGVVRRGTVSSSPGANVVARTSAEWQVLAHELGHNFGAVHDCTSGCGASGAELCCPLSRSSCDAQAQYMMNPSVSTRVSEFSPCSIGEVCSAWGQGNIETACLRGNDKVPIVSESQCGNGVVDPGEDCDCGGTAGCGSNACCEPTTCRFTAGATCDPSTQRCCTAQCGLATAGQVCRESIGLCDPQETCSGSSADCPQDVQLPDGQACGEGGLTCATGVCTSRATQCSKLLTSNNSTETVQAGGGNVTAEACAATGCEMNCMRTDAGGGAAGDGGVCQASAKFFRDGTSCGSGSLRCYGGTCSGQAAGGGGGDAASWIRQNRGLFVTVCVVGGVALLVSAAAAVCCCRQRARRRNAVGAQQARMATAMRQSGVGGGVGSGGGGGGDGASQQWQHRPAPPPPSPQMARVQSPMPVTRTGSNLPRYA